jgi:hypothetical protein
MFPRIEGYSQQTDRQNPPSVHADYLGQIREEARPALIRRMVMDRIQNGGYEDGPRQPDRSLIEQFLMAVGVGFTVSLLNRWIFGGGR